jgi:ABC-2 type transport system permease protein
MMSTVAYITFRGLFGRRRLLLLLPLPLLMIALALVCRGYDVEPSQWGQAVIVGLGFVVVLPVTSLIVGTGVLGSEVDDGTIVHILTKPLPRRDIIFAKLLVASAVSIVSAAIPMFVVGVLADSVSFGLALVVGSAVGAIAYTALFLLLSLVTRRPVLLGLVYVLVWEGLLARFISGTRVLSIEQYAIALADKIHPTDILPGKVSVPLAIVMSAIFAIGGTLYAIRRLGSFSVAGETS